MTDPALPQPDLKTLIRQFQDRRLDRRQLLKQLGAAGLSAATARSIAADFTPFVSQPGDAEPESLPSWARTLTASGGALLVAQLKAAGCKHIFVTPSSGQAPMFDALIDEPDIHLIQLLHEGSAAAAADGFGRASGTTPFVVLPRPGLPNAMTQMFNAWKDYTPMVVLVDDVDIATQGQDGFEALEHMTSMTAPIVKWHWSIEAAYKIPEVIRRAFKFSSTMPQRPVFLACPEDLLKEQASAAVIDQSRYTISTELRPPTKIVRQIAQLLAGASNPLIYAGDDVRYCHAEPELLKLARLLAIPVVNDLTVWSRPFPTDDPLYAGMFQPTARYPGKVDVMLHLGSRLQLGTGRQLRIEPQVKLIQVGLDANNLGRNFPSEVAVVADVKLALQDILAELAQMGNSGAGVDTAGRLQRAEQYQRERRALRDAERRLRWDHAPLSGERQAAELDAALPRDCAIVSENDTYKMLLETDFGYGAGGRDLYTTAGYALGWALPAALGVKLALPDRPVFALVTDGSLMFSGPQVLWSYARYRTPVCIIVLNNHSYNGERNRIMTGRGRAYQTGRDLVCYLGDPDIQFVQLAAGFGVNGEVVREPGGLRSALARAQQSVVSGRPYLLDVHMERIGSMANSTWHPEFQIASLRTHAV
jgi:thiamine pyrophosphate-dependent acetolactate synthase large subunit-like protein